MTPERAARIRAALAWRQPDLTVLTDQVHKGRNLSAIVRCCDAVGIGEIHAVVDEASFRTFRGTAMGSQQWVDIRRHAGLAEAAASLRAGGMQLLAAHPGADARHYREVDYTRPTALLLGAEREGLSAEAVALADVAVTVPMLGMVASLNVSVAAGIILSEAREQRLRAGLYARPRLPAELRARLLFERGYPQLAAFCQRHGLDYPALDADGQIADADRWYDHLRDWQRAGTLTEKPL